MNAFIDSLGWTLLHFVWQGAVVGIASALLLRCMGRSSPQQRYLVACAGLLACLVWPALSLSARLADADAGASLALQEQMRFGRMPVTSGTLAWVNLHMTQLVMAWAACALALALRMAAGLLWVRRCAARPCDAPHWQQRAQELAQRFGIRRTVLVRTADTLDTPVTAGWLRPLIVLPTALVSGMPPDLLDALLAHELAHVRRWDYLVNMAQNLIETVLFYHPAVWWLSRRVRAERELIADALAVQATGAPRELAQALSELDKRRQWTRVAVAANGGELVQRIRALVQPQSKPSNWSAALLAMVLALLAVAGVSRATDKVPRDPAYLHAVVDFTSCAKPVYPAEALAAQQTGTVTLAFNIAKTGDVIEGKVKRSSGHPSLDQAALEGIRQCHFKPARIKGKPVSTWQMMQYKWTLQ